MKSTPVGLLSLALGTGILAASGCSPDGVSPFAPPPVSASTGVISTTATLTAAVQDLLATLPIVTRNVPLARNVVVTQTIGPAGGTMTLADAKTTLVFAPGAVKKATLITATAYAGPFVVYGFEPHGTKFDAPVTLTVDLTTTNAYLHPEWDSTMTGGYTPDGLSDLDGKGNAKVSEKHAVKAKHGVSGTTQTLTSGSFVVPHFSGYILASGRSTKTTATR